MLFPEAPEAIRVALERRAITSSFSHVWSDALFARERAREEGRLIAALESTLCAESYATVDPRTAAVRERRSSHLRAKIHQHRWDRGAYARTCIAAAWRAFDRVVATVLGGSLRGDLLAELDAALQANSYLPLQHCNDTWRGLVALKESRDALLLGDCTVDSLLLDEHDADDALAVVRAALQELHEHIGRTPPRWVDADSSPQHVGNEGSWGTTIRGDARNDPDAIAIVMVHHAFEWTSDLVPHSVDPWSIALERLDSVCAPIVGVRVCQGDEVVEVLLWGNRGSVSSASRAARPGSAA
ncbi:MAG TPA: hypothetical protein VG755_03800 [Nannocystaceae bacterium]|nr:hypothetical protein [Nannocystaceae bacterium]